MRHCWGLELPHQLIIKQKEQELKEKEDYILWMKQKIEDLQRSKMDLAMKLNKTLDQMRDYLRRYQDAVFIKDI